MIRLLRRLSLRGRLILIGTTGLAVGLALGGVLLVAVLQAVLQRTLDDGARRTAADVSALVLEGRLPNPLPAAGGQVVQVLDDQGRIRSASVGTDPLVALLRPAEVQRARAGDVITVDGARIGLEGPLRVVALATGPASAPGTVIVGAPARDLEASLRTVRLALVVAYLLLVGVLAALAWRVVGWTLRPVEALRLGAEEITGAEPPSAGRSGRLPVPDGHDELHRLAVTLNGMLGRLESSRARQRAFVGDAAHELRSPLASLRTQLEVAQRLGEPVPAGDLLSDVHRLGRLVDDLLLLARADEADPRLRRRQPVELLGLLRDVAAACAGARVPVSVRSGRPQWTAGDPDGLRRIVENLVSNAVRHARTSVTLSAEPAGEGVAIVVRDDGSGIPPVDRERVFDRFTRLDDARARDTADPGGAGLGLAIVRELARVHGGWVALSDAGPGLCATVTLPALRNPPSSG